jgi:predicted Zn finger-like uncharacterized protein
VLTTTCSHCHTEFRITREQLTARAGQVRCGQCRTVFDALLSLRNTDIDPPSVEPREIATSPEAPLPAEALPATTLGPALPTEPLSFTPPEVDTATSLASAADPLVAPPVQPASDIDWPRLEGKDPGEAPVFSAPAAATSEPPGETLPSVAARRSAQIFEPAPESEAAAGPGKTAPEADFDFGPESKPRRRWWWMPLAFLLLLTLLGQGLYYFRGALALTVPELKPYIVEICAELGCDVPLPKRDELLGIESSDLQAEPARPGVMMLTATLRNRAAFPQAFPALELTLTNDRDIALARRVLLPADYLTGDTEAFEASSERQVRIAIEAGALKASGYRLYLFFP